MDNDFLWLKLFYVELKNQLTRVRFFFQLNRTNLWQMVSSSESGVDLIVFYC